MTSPGSSASTTRVPGYPGCAVKHRAGAAQLLFLRLVMMWTSTAGPTLLVRMCWLLRVHVGQAFRVKLCWISRQGLGLQGLAAAREAVGKFEASGTPWLRPPDYYAEMVKSDDHMQRVKAQLMHEQTNLEAAEDRVRTACLRQGRTGAEGGTASVGGNTACLHAARRAMQWQVWSQQAAAAIHAAAAARHRCMPECCQLCRRKQREARKFSKAVQAERVKEKAQARKAGVDALTRLRKQRQRQGFAGAPSTLHEDAAVLLCSRCW